MTGALTTQQLVQDRSRKFSRKLFIANLPRLGNGEYVDITRFITDLSVSYTMDMASSISFNIIDQEFRMGNNRYFSIGRDIIYETQTIGSIDSVNGEVRNVRQLFEISSVTAGQGPGGSPSYSVQCYSKAIQQMKRDKNPGAIKGNGSVFIRNAATKYGLRFYGQETSKAKQINKSSGSKQAESLWDVMTRLASDAKFVIFEVDGYLVFASEKWLLNKWGSDSKRQIRDKKNSKTGVTTRKWTTKRWVPLQFKNDAWNYNGRKNVFLLTQYPQITASDNDPYAASGSCLAERTNAVQLRPGMTAYVGLVPGLSNYYLIDSVTFQEMVPDPVSISFRTPTKDPEKENIRQLQIGEVYQQTYVPTASGQLTVKTVSQALAEQWRARDVNGNSSIFPVFDSRIISHPTEASPYNYPEMEFANISSSYPAFMGVVDAWTNTKNVVSTLDKDSRIVVGNLDLWNRPVYKTSTLVKRTKPAVVDSYILTLQSGSEWVSVIVPAVYTQNGAAVFKTLQQVTAKYNELGGYLGSAKHFGVFRGNSEAAAKANARDYLYLLVWQQEGLVMRKRFPSLAGNTPAIPNTPGGADSEWS